MVLHELVFADSEVAAVAVRGDGLCVRFSAAHVRRLLRPAGAGADEGYVPALELHFERACWEDGGRLQACIGPLAQVQWCEETAGPRRSLPLPYASPGAVEAHFEFRNGERLAVRAASACVEAPDGLRFLESLAC
ncbi:hypothetical protein [Azohydromonas australica]|uniref:hypothetical protein n=1 Tax=Azohydromonas australica TaxID=364039 RepID=UPI00048E51B6|nr:hypothetical protein [Azohydromonas australica]